MQLTTDQIREAVKKHGSQRKAAAALGIAQSTLSGALRSGNGVAASRVVMAGQSGCRTLAEFRQLHDKNFIIPNKINAALKSMGKAGWAYEMVFAKLAGISLGDLSAFRAMFEDHVVLVDRTKRAWAGTKATANAMRAMVQ